MKRRLSLVVGMSFITLLLLVSCTYDQMAAPTAKIIGAPLRVSSAEGPTVLYSFYDCSGPAGTPRSFTAVRTAVPSQTGAPVSAAAAFRLTDGSALFVVLTFDTAFSPPGIGESENATVTCSVVIDGTVSSYSGFLSPR